ncbi:MAG: hypothetical protein GY938_13555 [Ketobacter sp.]|nr:hypothetical protein [Ketobacter sp.]
MSGFWVSCGPTPSLELAANGLRVALSALRQSLNPDHSPRDEFTFLKRERDLLGLDMSAGILVDTDEFTLLIKKSRRLKEAKPEQAIELYALMTKQPFVGKSQWFTDMVGQRVEAAEATLPAEEVAAAQTRGRALDIWEMAQSLLDELTAPTPFVGRETELARLDDFLE